MADAATRRSLFEMCKEFIVSNEITCPEAIYQTDEIISNAYEFIESLCDLIGYAELRDQEDDEEE